VQGSAPGLSVVIAAYNAARFIGETLESVFVQSVTDYEVIVIDDGSTDATPAVLEAITDSRLQVIRQDNAGVSSARNRGIAAARGRFLLILDADDILAPNALARHLAVFEAQPDAVLTYGEAPIFQSDDGPPAGDSAPTGGLFHGRPQGDTLRAMLVANPITTVGCTMVRHEAVRQTGGFPMGVELGEEWVFWCDLAALGSVVWLGPEPVLYYRIHPNSRARVLALDPNSLRLSIDMVFSRESVRARFSEAERRRLRRLSESSAFAYCGQEMLKADQWQQARHSFQAALSRRPLFIRSWILWACACLRFIPAPIRRRLK